MKEDKWSWPAPEAVASLTQADYDLIAKRCHVMRMRIESVDRDRFLSAVADALLERNDRPLPRRARSI